MEERAAGASRRPGGVVERPGSGVAGTGGACDSELHWPASHSLRQRLQAGRRASVPRIAWRALHTEQVRRLWLFLSARPKCLPKPPFAASAAQAQRHAQPAEEQAGRAGASAPEPRPSQTRPRPAAGAECRQAAGPGEGGCWGLQLGTGAGDSRPMGTERRPSIACPSPAFVRACRPWNSFLVAALQALPAGSTPGREGSA